MILDNYITILKARQAENLVYRTGQRARAPPDPTVHIIGKVGCASWANVVDLLESYRALVLGDVVRDGKIWDGRHPGRGVPAFSSAH